MGQISSGVGLISGINFADLIDQLLAIESRPKTLVAEANARLTTQQVAFQDINAKLLAHKLTVTSLLSDAVFDATTASSSNTAVLTATSTNSATPGTYSFAVDRLVSTQQVISSGFVDQDTTPIGAGTLTFEFGDARLDSQTDLASLGGGAGVQRGNIRITDRTGASAIIDLARSLTADDVVKTINTVSDVNVTASIDGDGLVIKDNTGSTAATLKVEGVGTSTTAADLGLTAAAVGDRLIGNQINLITGKSLLSSLNDGLGVRTVSALGDIQIDTQDGGSFTVNLDSATDIDGMSAAIAMATLNTVVAKVDPSGTGIQLLDTTIGVETFTITALNGSKAATDLGILQSDHGGPGQISSRRLIAEINSKLVGNLNGGSGATLGQISINNRADSHSIVDLTDADSISDVIDRINAAGVGVTASLNVAGNGLLLADTTGASASNLTVTDVTGSGAVDLNIAADVAAATVDSGNLQFRYVAENTLLAALNGGRGVARGQFEITDSDGNNATVDLSQGNETTVQDVLDEINSRGLDINARVNDNGDGILIEDLGSGVVKLLIEESGSTTARDLGIRQEAVNAGDDIDGTYEKTVTVTATDTLADIAQAVNDADLDVAAVIINDGSADASFRLSLTSQHSGLAGAFVFDDGGLGLGAWTLVKAANARVFFGSADPAQALAIQSASNTLQDVVPGATIDLKSTSASPVQVTINRDDSVVTDAVTNFVDAFNVTVETIGKYDVFDEETETRGTLLGDPTVGSVRNALFRVISKRNIDLTGQFNSLSQMGVRVVSGGRLSFDSTKFLAALQTDRDEVKQLFTFKEAVTDPDTGEVTLASGGIMARFEEMLDRFTGAVGGTIQSRVNAIDQQIELGNKRIETLDQRLEARREVLGAQFIGLERTLASLQNQSSALASLAPSIFQPRNKNTNSGGLLF